MGMGGRPGSTIICDGTINTEVIYNTHHQIRKIVESYKEINLKISRITKEVNENWVGQGNIEFQSQYKLLISKVEDFGDTLKDIYDALVTAEAKYEDKDDSIRQDFQKSLES